MQDISLELKRTQIEILKVIDRICRDHDIKYSLFYGSLLGAVRHQGIIPWDDDLDICMSREDYNRFTRIWSNVNPQGYILQNKENSHAFSEAFTKIRKDHTCFLQKGERANAYHNGIFVDIFPIDRLPNGKMKRFVFKLNCKLYQLFTRELVPSKINTIAGAIFSILLLCTPHFCRMGLREKLLKKITKYNSNTALETVNITTKAFLETPFSSTMLNNYTELDFSNEKFMCYEEWDDCLTRIYGDYMQLPPEEERVWKHHPIIIDFSHNYDELENAK
ncbi:MAG: LicD family protein [Candidatus Omnitrophica bacterium ADurb.Bin292]|nr:MAG: LicD family protein [Candidatus Omnitrophica bacterium ADurb.Bin292]HPW76602.1 LicD family protein [Candidatus Omnitrophota bacterium]HQB11403.1 LicD family protein [Candidatus Omnitrophota bacterium]